MEELEGLKLGQLQRRAVAAGVPAETVTAALDDDDAPKQKLIAAILQHTTRPTEGSPAEVVRGNARPASPPDAVTAELQRFLEDGASGGSEAAAETEVVFEEGGPLGIEWQFADMSVKSVMPSSQAERRGVRVGLFALSIDGLDPRQMGSSEDIQRALQRRPVVVVFGEAAPLPVPPLGRRGADPKVEWMYADAGFAVTREIAKLNPARWSSGAASVIAAKLAVADINRPIDVRIKGGSSEIHSFEDKSAARRWLAQLQEPDSAAEALMQRIFECDSLDSDLSVLPCEAFCSATRAWADVKITHVSLVDCTVDVEYVNREGEPAPQRGRYGEKGLPVADGGNFRCKARPRPVVEGAEEAGASLARAVDPGSARGQAERARPRLAVASTETVVLAPRARTESGAQLSVPDPPTGLRTAGLAADGSVPVSWQVPLILSNEHDTVRTCELDWGARWGLAGWETVPVENIGHNTWQVSLKHADLQPDYNLTLRVRARNAQGWSKWSDHVHTVLGAPASDGQKPKDAQLARSLSTASTARVECVLGDGVDDENAVGMDVELFHNGGWVAAKIAQLSVEDEIVTVDFVPLNVQAEARLYMESNKQESFIEVRVTRDSANVLRFYYETASGEAQDSPFRALPLGHCRARAPKTERKGFTNAFRLDYSSSATPQPHERDDEEEEEAQTYHRKEVQLDHDVGKVLRLPRLAQPSAKLILAAEDDGDRTSWRDAISATPLAPILDNVPEPEPEPEPESEPDPEPASPLSYRHGLVKLGATAVSKAGMHFCTLHNSILCFHWAEDGEPRNFKLNRSMSVLPTGRVDVKDWQFMVRCEDCIDVKRTSRTSRVELECIATTTLDPLVTRVGGGQETILLLLDFTDRADAVQWEAEIREAKRQRSVTRTEMLLRPCMRDLTSVFEQIKEAPDHVQRNSHMDKLTTLRKKLERGEHVAAAIKAGAEVGRCFVCGTAKATTAIQLPRTSEFSADVPSANFARVLGLSANECAGLSVEIFAKEYNSGCGQWVHAWIISVSSAARGSVAVGYGEASHFVKKDLNVVDARSFRLPVGDLSEPRPPSHESPSDIIAEGIPPTISPAVMTARELSAESLASEPEPEPELMPFEHSSDCMARSQARFTPPEREPESELAVEAAIRTVLGRRPGNIIGMCVEVFSESCGMWLSSSIIDYDLSAGVVVANYDVSARQCSASNVAGLREKEISIKDGRMLRLPRPAPHPTFLDSWIVKQGRMLRENKPHWTRILVTLYSDGRIELTESGSRARSPALPGHIDVGVPKTPRADHPGALRLDFVYASGEGEKWKLVVEPEDPDLHAFPKGDDGWIQAIAQVQTYPAVPACEACCESLSSLVSLPEARGFREFQLQIRRDMRDVELWLSVGDLRSVKKKSSDWKMKKAANARMSHMAKCMPAWIDHRLSIAGQPDQPVDSSCPYEIMRRSLSDVLDKADGHLKALVVSDETLALVSTVFSLNDLAARGVFLAPHKVSQHSRWHRASEFEAVVYIGPTDKNVEHLEEELKAPSFKCFHIVFAGHLDIHDRHWYDEATKRLALADRFGVIRSVEQSLTGFFPGNEFFLLEGGASPAANDELESMPFAKLQDRARSAGVDQRALTDAIDQKSSPNIIKLIQARQRVQQLLGALLSFGRPFVQYSVSDERSEAHDLALAITACTSRGTASARWDLLAQTALRSDRRPLLLVLDRNEDPITPLLAPLTYQAMVHDVLGNGIEGNAIKFKSRDGESCMCTLRPEDEFWAKHCHSFWPEVALAVEELKGRYTALAAQAKDRKAEAIV